MLFKHLKTISTYEHKKYKLKFNKLLKYYPSRDTIPLKIAASHHCHVERVAQAAGSWRPVSSLPRESGQRSRLSAVSLQLFEMLSRVSHVDQNCLPWHLHSSQPVRKSKEKNKPFTKTESYVCV
jgi:hypothetical protein